MARFITFEGIEGSGKSTQVEMAAGVLKRRFPDLLHIREPGGTDIGEKIRDILLHSDSTGMERVTELLLYEASRAELIGKVIRPALEEDRIIICDRFTDSTLAYQAYGRRLDEGIVIGANELATEGLKPDLTIILDLDPEVGLSRAWGRIDDLDDEKDKAEDRFEREAIDFHKRVRDGYLAIAKADPKRYKVVDGNREISVIHRDICAIINRLL